MQCPQASGQKSEGEHMGEITHFIAIAFDLTDHGLVAGEPFKCRTPAAAIERAKGLWKTFGHTGAVASLLTGYPVSRTTVLRTFRPGPPDFPIHYAPHTQRPQPSTSQST